METTPVWTSRLVTTSAPSTAAFMTSQRPSCSVNTGGPDAVCPVWRRGWDKFERPMKRKTKEKIK